MSARQIPVSVQRLYRIFLLLCRWAAGREARREFTGMVVIWVVAGDSPNTDQLRNVCSSLAASLYCFSLAKVCGVDELRVLRLVFTLSAAFEHDLPSTTGRCCDCIARNPLVAAPCLIRKDSVASLIRRRARSYSVVVGRVIYLRRATVIPLRTSRLAPRTTDCALRKTLT